MSKFKIKSERSLKTAKDVADFWSITHIISVDSVEAWQEVFKKLYQATIMLDKLNSHVVDLEREQAKLVSQLKELELESSMYFKALDKLSEKYELDIADYISLEE